jgi:hypothetical protein
LWHQARITEDRAVAVPGLREVDLDSDAEHPDQLTEIARDRRSRQVIRLALDDVRGKFGWRRSEFDGRTTAARPRSSTGTRTATRFASAAGPADATAIDFLRRWRRFRGTTVASSGNGEPAGLPQTKSSNSPALAPSTKARNSSRV